MITDETLLLLKGELATPQTAATAAAPSLRPSAAKLFLQRTHLLMDTSLLVGLGGHSLLVADGSPSVPLSSTLMGKQHCICSTLSGDETYQTK